MSKRLVFGARPVAEVLRARPKEIQALFVAADKRDERLAQELQRAGIQPEPRSAGELDRLSQGGNHQGVVAVVGEFRYAVLEEVVEGSDASPELPLLVLDQVQDPHNLGAILRSAEALGVAGVVLPERRAVAVTSAVVRTSAGATEHLRIARVGNLGRALDALEHHGIWRVGAVGEGGQPPEALDLSTRVALVLGSEGRGLRPGTLKRCDLQVTLPMVGRVESLNVSVAAGILLAEAARQRRQRGQ